ncbi:MAG TPA: type II secretion system protein [Burkholderiales bacterium]|nr:type II secretion system protein [Burkholderiales bacterium]
MRAARRSRASGFTYAGILIAVALVGLGLALTGEVWQTTVQRDRERELLFAGDEIRRAITQYYESTPGTGKQFPKSLDDLVRDSRYPTTRRYLRKVYPDPMTGQREWGLVKGPGDGIMGVYSLSRKTPLKRANFPPEYAAFEKAESYAAWLFAYSDSHGPQAGRTEATAAAPGVPQPLGAPIPASAVVGQPPLTPPTQESGGTAQRK